MDEKVARLIQREGAAALLDRGVSVPLKDIRLPFRKPLRQTVVFTSSSGLLHIGRVALAPQVFQNIHNCFLLPRSTDFVLPAERVLY